MLLEDQANNSVNKNSSDIEHAFAAPEHTLLDRDDAEKDAEARFSAMATRVGTTTIMRAIIMEELPEPHRLKKLTTLYLIPESILSVYILSCLILIDDLDVASNDDYVHKDAVAAWLFICNIPFMALRVISLLCCNSVRLIPWQIFGIWFLNMVCYAAWSIYALIEMVFKDEKSDDFCMEFMNMVLLLVLFSMSIPIVVCALPFFCVKLKERANRDKETLARKIGQVRLLPRVLYDERVHTSLTFCTICTENFSHLKCRITYLPCDARHYFHSKCAKSWLMAHNTICPLCKVPVNFSKSICHDQKTDYNDLLKENVSHHMLEVHGCSRVGL